MGESIHPCPWCDLPASYSSEDGWEHLCHHHDYGAHENSEGDAENDAYETLQRLRGVEVLPWEYPHLQNVLLHISLEPRQFVAAFTLGYSSALRAVLRSAERVHREILTTDTPSRKKWMLEGILLAHTIADDCREAVLRATEEAYRDAIAPKPKRSEGDA